MHFISSSCHYFSLPSFLPFHHAISNFLTRCFVLLPLVYLHFVYSFSIPLTCSPVAIVVLYPDNSTFSPYKAMLHWVISEAWKSKAVVYFQTFKLSFCWKRIKNTTRYLFGCWSCEMSPKFVRNMCEPNITHILACSPYSGLVFVSVCVQMKIRFPCSVRDRIFSLITFIIEGISSEWSPICKNRPQHI
jgi:hypothetical protein